MYICTEVACNKEIYAACIAVGPDMILLLGQTLYCCWARHDIAVGPYMILLLYVKEVNQLILTIGNEFHTLETAKEIER